MSKAVCPKCDFDEFEAVMQSISNIRTNVAIIKCKSCSAAIGVLDVTTSDRVYDILTKLKGG